MAGDGSCATAYEVSLESIGLDLRPSTASEFCNLCDAFCTLTVYASSVAGFECVPCARKLHAVAAAKAAAAGVPPPSLPQRFQIREDHLEWPLQRLLKHLADLDVMLHTPTLQDLDKVRKHLMSARGSTPCSLMYTILAWLQY